MPKKKGKKEKKGKKGAKQLSAGGESEREMLERKERDLKEELAQLTERWDSLKEEKEKAQSLYEDEVREKDSIVTHLQSVLKNEVDRALGKQEEFETAIAESKTKRKELGDKIVALKGSLETLRTPLKNKEISASGKLSTLLEIAMTRKELIEKKHDVLKRLEDAVNENEAINNKYDYNYVKKQDELKNEFLDRAQVFSSEFTSGASKQLPYIIKKYLKKDLKMYRDVNRLAEAGLEAKDRNKRLLGEEILWEFKLKVEGDTTEEIAHKVECNRKVIEEMKRKCEEQKDLERTLDLRFEEYKSTAAAFREFRLTCLEAKDEFHDLEKQRVEQKRYLDVTRALLTRRRNINSKMRSAIIEVQQAIAQEMAKDSEDDFETPRFDLLKRLRELLKVSSLAESEASTFESSEIDEKSVVSVSVQTIGL